MISILKRNLNFVSKEIVLLGCPHPPNSYSYPRLSLRSQESSGFAFCVAAIAVGTATCQQTRCARCPKCASAGDKRASVADYLSLSVGVKEHLNYSLQLAAGTLVDDLLAQEEVELFE